MNLNGSRVTLFHGDDTVCVCPVCRRSFRYRSGVPSVHPFEGIAGGRAWCCSIECARAYHVR